MITLKLKEVALSDKSLVYDLLITQENSIIVIPSVSQKDGEDMMEHIAEVINAHSLETVVTGF